MPADRRLTLAVAGVAAAALALRLGMAARDVVVLDRLFVPDDTYYTLAIARSLADGAGPTADGVTLTSGFQPLIAFLLVPVFWVTDGLDAPFRAALVIGALADVATCVLLARLAWRLAGPPAAVLAAALWAVSPLALANALNGLETSLALACQLALVEAWWRARDAATTGAAVVAGLAAGLAVLARVDSLLLVAVLGVLELLRRRAGVRLVAVAGAAAGVLVAPWWLYSTVRFGSPVPESGSAVLELVSIHRSVHLETGEQLGWAAGTVLGAPAADLARLREWLFDAPLAGSVVWSAIAAVLVAGGAWLIRRSSDRPPVVALVAHAVAVLAFYSFVVAAVWFFRRYLAPVQGMVTLLAAVALGVGWVRWRGRPARGLVAVVAAALVLVGAHGSVELLTAQPDGTVDVGLHGAKGYRDAAKEILAAVPPGSVVGSLQSGALGWFAGDDVRIVNLDGVVDGEAAEALRDGRLAELARARGVTHLADWQFNIETFLARSGDPALTPDRLEPVAEAGSQGGDRFVLVRVRWP